MKKLLLIIAIISTIAPFSPAMAAENIPVKSLIGKILLQSENNDHAWYVDPVSLKRFDLRDGEEMTKVIKTLGLGITNKDLAKIPTEKGKKGNTKLINKLKGRILLQKENGGAVWYVDPVSGIRTSLPSGDAAIDQLKNIGLEVNNKTLAKIAMNSKQLVQDPFFKTVASVRYDGEKFSGGSNSNQVLALASLSKLMTALVILDTNPVWDRRVTITDEEINYPKTLVGGDATSEVALAAGDNVSFYDLWVAMLVASSNQSAITLADSTGMSREEFVSRMNLKAKDLGLTKTIFYDPTGLDYRNVTTAKEMAKLAYAAFSRPEIIEADRHKDYSINAFGVTEPKEIKVLDRNYSLRQFEVEASKTGFLIEAQRTVAIKKDGAIIVVMHALSMPQRNSIIEKLLKL